MRHKNLKLSVLLLGLGLTGLHAQNIYVKTKSGMQTPYTLSGIKKMTFSSGNILISKKVGGSDSYALTNLFYLNFNTLTESVAEMNEESKQLVTYPNPANAELNIQLKGLENQTVSIEILSNDGRVVYNKELQNSTITHKVNITGFPNGLYLCRITSGTTTKTTKFIKQ